MCGSKPRPDNRIDSSGVVNTNIILKNTDTLNVHNNEIIWILFAILVIKLLEMLLFVYYKHRRGLKKQYSKNSENA